MNKSIARHYRKLYKKKGGVKKMNLRLPSQDSATGRGIKTGLQSILGFVFTFAVGLVLTVWGVKGVPEAIMAYIQTNFLQVLVTIGVPSAVAGFIWNYFRPNIPNY